MGCEASFPSQDISAIKAGGLSFALVILMRGAQRFFLFCFFPRGISTSDVRASGVWPRQVDGAAFA